MTGHHENRQYQLTGTNDAYSKVLDFVSHGIDEIWSLGLRRTIWAVSGVVTGSEAAQLPIGVIDTICPITSRKRQTMTWAVRA